MFKTQRWRNEKIKAVFKLQFQATQVTDSGSWLMISVVPADVGQPTARLGKALVQDGSCTWENPIYETVKLIRDPKTGKVQDKIYHFVLATGPPRKCLLGEVSINFTDYIEALSVPIDIYLPVKGSCSGAILHVNMQNMQGADETRDTQENWNLRVKPGRKTLHSLMGDCKSDGSDLLGSIEDNKSCSELRESSALDSVTLVRSVVDPSKDTAQALAPGDHTVSQKKREALTKKTRVSEETELDAPLLQYKNHSSQYRNDYDKSSRESEQYSSGTTIEGLKREITTLKRRGEVMVLELESLKRQVVKESEKGQQLSSQIISLTKERSVLRAECEALQLSRYSINGTGPPARKDTVSRSQLKEIEEELAREKDMNKGLKMQLLETQETNFELILEVKELTEMLDKRSNDSSHATGDKKRCLYCKKYFVEDSQEKTVSEGNDNEQVVLLRDTIDNVQDEGECGIKGRKEMDEEIKRLLEDYEISQQKISELQLKFEQNHDELVKKENECESYVRIIEDHEAKITMLKKEIKEGEERCSEATEMAHTLEAQVKSLKEELESQAAGFEADLCDMEKAKLEEKQKALEAEEELKQAKLSHATTAMQLEEEFGQLYEQLVSKINENEKLVVKLRLEITGLEEDLKKGNNEITSIKHHYDLKVQELLNQLVVQERESEKLLLKLQDELTEDKHTRQKEEEKKEVIHNENQFLTVDVERLAEKNKQSSKQLEQSKELSSEMERMKRLTDGTKKLLEGKCRERDDLEEEYASMGVEAGESQERLNEMRLLQEEKGEKIMSLQSELETLGHCHGELKNNLVEEKLENEKLRKKIMKQKEDQQKKGTAAACEDDKYKNKSFRKGEKCIGMSPENSNEAEDRRPGVERRQAPEILNWGLSPHNGASRAARRIRWMGDQLDDTKFGRRDTCKEKTHEAPAPQADNEGDHRDLMAELTALKEKNKSMEDELKEMQEKYSEVSLKFAEVEGERQQLVMTIRNLRNSQKSTVPA